jgi:hypothetical protein
MLVSAIKVCEIGVYLQNPIWLDENNCADEKSAASRLQEMFTFHPGNNIVQGPRRYQGHNGGGEKPTPGWWFEKCKEAIGNGQGKLNSKAQASVFRTCNQLQLSQPVSSRTSSRMSLCRITPLRIFASVMPAMMISDPTIKPCDQDSNVICSGLVGFKPRWEDSASVIVAI